MNKPIFFLLIMLGLKTAAQPQVYSTANLHSHNDYEKPFPYWEAYNQGFGSIEADIFLYHNNLIVAHDTIQRTLGRTLDSLYLQPLQECIKKNDGYPYADHSKMLQLLVDVKADSTATLGKLVEKLQAYPQIIHCKALKIVISGNRPPIAGFANYPAYVWFDGELRASYPPSAMAKIEMLSDNFRALSRWNGIDSLPANEKKLLEEMIARAHQQGKKVRFWNAPDMISSWKGFVALGVDYINTDHITAAATFFKK